MYILLGCFFILFVVVSKSEKCEDNLMLQNLRDTVEGFPFNIYKWTRTDV